MKNKLALFFASALFISILFSQACSPGDPVARQDKQKGTDLKDSPECKKPVNPNGDAPLAILMRKMAAWGEETHKNLSNGDNLPPVNMEEFNTLITATPTDSTVKGEPYTGYAKSWLASVENLYKSDKTTQARLFNAVITQCVTCHESYCQGPIKRINKLFVN